jgi:hypothetical protein
MGAELELTLTPAALRELLLASDEHLPPAVILGGLSGEQACAMVAGLPHSIATLTGHLLFWIERRLAWGRSEDPPEWTEAENWPQLTPEQWPGVVARFLACFDELCELCASREMAAELYRGRSLGFMLASECCHNSYHLGQIVLLRRMQNYWPPPGVVD